MKTVQLLGSAKDGGAETYFLALVAASQADGLPQACVVRPHPARERRLDAVDVPFVTAPFGGVLDLVTTGRVRRFARQQQAGVGG